MVGKLIAAWEPQSPTMSSLHYIQWAGTSHERTYAFGGYIQSSG